MSRMLLVVRSAVVAYGLLSAGLFLGQSPAGAAGTAAAARRPPATAPAAAAPRPATPVATQGKKAVDPRTIQVLMDDGQTALSDGDFKAARDAFSDVVSLEPRNSAALASLGYAYLKLDDFPRARNALDAAVTTSGAAPQSQSLALNAAASLLRTRNAMRAAKFVKDYMLAHPAEVDEACLNALGTSLSLADEQSRALRFFQECATYYEAANAKLEATKPGEKRWGSQWMSAHDADKKMSAYKAQLAEMNKYDVAMGNARAKFANAEAAIQKAKVPMGFRNRTPIDTRPYEAQKVQADSEFRAAQEQYNAAMAKLERPPFAPMIDPVAPEAAGTTAVASATGIGAAAGTVSPGGAGTSGGTGAAPTTPTAVRPTTPTTPTAVKPTTPVAVAVATPTPAPAVVTPAPIAPAPVPVAPAPPKRTVVTMYAAAFPVAPDLLVTSAAAVEKASRVTVQSSDGTPIEVTVVERDTDSGLALLRSSRKMAYLSLADAFNGGTIQCVSFPTVNVFDPVAEAIGGSAIPPKDDWAVRLTRHPRLGGGPLLAGGKVVGVQLATRDADIAQVPAATLADLKKFLAGKAAAGGTGDPAAVTMQLTAVREKGS